MEWKGKKVLNHCPKLARLSPVNGDMVAVVLDDGGSIMLNNQSENSSWFHIKMSDDVSDIDFFPGFNSSVIETQTMLVSSRNRPIQLVHTSDGSVLSAYTAYSFTEEIVHPLSVKFDPSNCATIIGGFQSSTVRVWDVQRPGRQVRDLVFATRKEDTKSIKGIVGAVNYWNSDTVFAGTYSRSFGLFDIRDKEKGMVFGQKSVFGSVVQIESFSNQVVTNHRNEDKSLRLWDVRNPDTPVVEFDRSFPNHQRSTFGLFKNGEFIVAGNIGGNLIVFSTLSGQRVADVPVSPGVPTVAVHATQNQVVVGSGCRVFDPVISDDSDDSDAESTTSSFRVDFYTISL
jgi:WD40 repeat protein